jgi:hypothetical protein
MLYNSSTKWNSEYYVRAGNMSSLDETNANDYGMMLMSEFEVDAEENDDYELSDFKITNHTLAQIPQQHIPDNDTDWTSDDDSNIF